MKAIVLLILYLHYTISCDQKEFDTCHLNFRNCTIGEKNDKKQICSCLTDYGNCLSYIDCVDDEIKSVLESNCKEYDCENIGFCNFNWNSSSKGNRLCPIII